MSSLQMENLTCQVLQSFDERISDSSHSSQYIHIYSANGLGCHTMSVIDVPDSDVSGITGVCKVDAPACVGI